MNLGNFLLIFIKGNKHMSGNYFYNFYGSYNHKNTDDLGDHSDSKGSTFNLFDNGSGNWRFSMGTPGWETVNWTTNNTNTKYGSALNFAYSGHNTVNLSGNLTNFRVENMGNYNTIFVKGSYSNSNYLTLGGYGNGALLSGNNNSINVTGGGTGSSSGYSNYNWADTNGSNNNIYLYGTNSPGTEYALIHSNAGSGNKIIMYGNNGTATVLGGSRGTVIVDQKAKNNSVVIGASRTSVFISGTGTNTRVDTSSNTIFANGAGNAFNLANNTSNELNLYSTSNTINYSANKSVSAANNFVDTEGGNNFKFGSSGSDVRRGCNGNLGTFQNFSSNKDYIEILNASGYYFNSSNFNQSTQVLTISTSGLGDDATYTAKLIEGDFQFKYNDIFVNISVPHQANRLVEAMASITIPQASGISSLASTSSVGATPPALAVVH